MHTDLQRASSRHLNVSQITLIDCICMPLKSVDRTCFALGWDWDGVLGGRSQEMGGTKAGGPAASGQGFGVPFRDEMALHCESLEDARAMIQWEARQRILLFRTFQGIAKKSRDPDVDSHD
jgi:hypothetical protein